MSNTIQLITPEALTAQWDQLHSALLQTEAMMKAVGVPLPARTPLSPIIKTDNQESPAKPQRRTPPVSNPSGTRGAVSDIVREFYPASEGKPFDIAEVRKFIDGRCPGNEFSRTSISAALSYDASCGRLKIITQGGAGKPSVYQVP